MVGPSYMGMVENATPKGKKPRGGGFYDCPLWAIYFKEESWRFFTKARLKTYTKTIKEI